MVKTKLFKKSLVVFITIFLLATAIFPLTNAESGIIQPKAEKTSENNSDKQDYATNEIIVKFKEKAEITPELVRNNVKTFEKLSKQDTKNVLSDVYKITYTKNINLPVVLAKYKLDSNVEYAEPNYIYHTCNVPNDMLLDSQWALAQSNDYDIDATEAWDIETGNSSITIAIVDTGVDYNHPDLASNIWNNPSEVPGNGIDDDNNGYVDDTIGWDFISNDNNPIDYYGHGTHCAGIATGVGNNSIGMSGVCWNCKIMPLKILNNFGKGTSFGSVDAIIYAVDNGADVISMSWGGIFYSRLLKDALNYAHDQGVVLVAGAGNYNSDIRFYPAAYENVIAVAATNKYDEKYSFSNWGSWVDIAAPGEDILSLRADNTNMNPFGDYIVHEDYYVASGTSMACPHVAGVAGLLLSKNPGLSPDETKDVICESADRLPPTVTKYIGSGRLNAYMALQRGQNHVSVEIISPSHCAQVKNMVDIVGSTGGNGFQYFILKYCKGKNPENGVWMELVNSTENKDHETIVSWDTSLLDEGLYNLRLSVVCNDGVYSDTIHLVVNNEYSMFVVDDDGGTDYTKVQEAIYDSGDGDTVFVKIGTYNENIIVDKSINLTGEDSYLTVVDGNMKGNVITVITDEVNVSCFTILNSAPLCCGLYLLNVDNCVISHNTINKNNIGIKLKESNNNIIELNNIENNLIGCRILKSTHNKVTKNNFIIDVPRVFYEHATYMESYFNTWKDNYWSDWIGLKSTSLSWLPKRIPYRISDLSFVYLYRTLRIRSNFDWHPVTEPYGI